MDASTNTLTSSARARPTRVQTGQRYRREPKNSILVVIWERTQADQRLRLCLWRFSNLRCLCLRIFLRRFLITLPTEYLVA